MRSLLSLAGTLLAMLVCAATLHAQAVAEEDDADDENPQVQPFEIAETDFEYWVFSDGRSAQEVRAQQEKLLRLQVEDVGRADTLTDSQRGKLELAGRADIRRYFEDVEVVRKKFLVLRKDREKVNQVFEDLRPLQLRLAAGLFGNESLFRKTLRRTLPAEALARYEQLERERRALRYRAKVEWLVAMLDNGLAMTDKQRQGITRLLLVETRPPIRSGDMDHYVILSQMSLLPEEMLRPWFNDSQWKAIQVQFTEVKNLEKYLNQQGFLTLDDQYTPPEDVSPDPAVSSQ